MYGFECSKTGSGACKDKRCLYPKPCLMLKIDHQPSLSLLDKARKIPGIKRVFVASGIRYDMILHDRDAERVIPRTLQLPCIGAAESSARTTARKYYN